VNQSGIHAGLVHWTFYFAKTPPKAWLPRHPWRRLSAQSAIHGGFGHRSFTSQKLHLKHGYRAILGAACRRNPPSVPDLVIGVFTSQKLRLKHGYRAILGAAYRRNPASVPDWFIGVFTSQKLRLKHWLPRHPWRRLSAQPAIHGAACRG
jgi:hypothetical protein